ncbi:hypothetical protein PS029_21130, partial [Yersinia pestis]|nr:hypothetical protein [Yersinia pestis]
MNRFPISLSSEPSSLSYLLRVFPQQQQRLPLYLLEVHSRAKAKAKSGCWVAGSLKGDFLSIY